MDAKTIAKNITPNQWNDIFVCQGILSALKNTIEAAYVIDEAKQDDLTNILTKVRDETNSFSLEDLIWHSLQSLRVAALMPLETVSNMLSVLGAREASDTLIGLHTMLIANVAADSAFDSMELTITCGPAIYNTLKSGLEILEEILLEK